MAKSRGSILRQLETNGYLSLAAFIQYLRQYVPEAAVSYPTAVKLVNAGKIQAKRVGGTWRIGRGEIERWIAEGNYDPLI